MHGITTVLVGNCGVSFAPVSKGNEETLAKIMESVEDISAKAIMDGLPWSWTDYGGYLDAVQDLKPALNVVGLVGHAAIRYDAMGDRSIDHHEHPTDAELERMCELVRESMAAGAVGFSTSRLHGHAVPDGRQMPGTFAQMRELRAIQQAVVEGGGEGAIFQFVPEIKSLAEAITGVANGADPETLVDGSRTHEFRLMLEAVERGCHVMFSGGTLRDGDGCFNALMAIRSLR
jgi:N-acyl-D-amino-acid deacylase